MQALRRRPSGFSLIELMIVLVIVAILLAIAVPSYRRYVIRGNRVDAQRTLVDLAGRQERYYYTNNAYTTSLSNLGSADTAAGTNYTVGVASASTTAFVVQAVPLGKQLAQDKQCSKITLSNTGVQGSTGTTANDPGCWSR